MHEALSFWELDPAVIYDAKVIMSELLTNAVKASSEIEPDPAHWRAPKAST
ncbi:hypothetical protein PH213_37225 [Streptomyces sp. SRF1]|uniref:hypothetical protein n=1 Tax=Streptomyces sp. SRF1 TaxID=1549642 RepID=UPI0025B1F228|nr:hypothetical protein [Streptomyces sp. SRF1]MDN3060062.1 hypothetical protein [Streptomyces sp. SRF1]